MTTRWQVTYPNTFRENLITRGLAPFAAIVVVCVLLLEFVRSKRSVIP